MIEALHASPELETSALWFEAVDLSLMKQIVDRADALVLCRTAYNSDIATLISYAKARKIPVYFDIDDLVSNIDYVHLVLNALRQQTSEQAWDH
jgi:ABC-type uncharacterized transport system substrate-binding protein